MAGQANSPGAFSKRTVNFLSDLDKADAELFTRLCDFVWVVGNYVPLIYDVKDDIYKEHGLTFSSLKHLESIGLIHFPDLGSFKSSPFPEKYVACYYDQSLTLEMPKESGNSIELGNAVFTLIGHELFRICGSQPVPGFLDYVREKWKRLKYIKEDETEQRSP